MRRSRRFVEVAVLAPLGTAATIAAALHRRRHPVPADGAGPEPAAAVAPDRVPSTTPAARVPRAQPPAHFPAEQLPIDGYDHLAASQVVDRLAALTADELELVDVYERGKRHRQSVLAKIAQLQG